MLQLHIGVCVLFLLISKLSAEQNNNNNTKPTRNVASEILAKFHQSDYNLTFEWAEVVRCNKRFGEATIRTFKYNRTCTAMNSTFVANVDLGYETEVIMQAYKFLSNEYRLFPIRLQFNFCEGISKNTMGTGDYGKCGNASCPLFKGKVYYFCNWKLDSSMFPPFIPNGKYMQGIFGSEELFIYRYYGTISRSIV